MRLLLVGFSLLISGRAGSVDCPLLSDAVVARAGKGGPVATLRNDALTVEDSSGKWELSNPKKIRILKMSFCPSRDLLFVASQRGNVGVVPLQPPHTALEMDERADRGPITALLSSPSGKFVVTMHGKNSITIWYGATQAGFQSVWEQELPFAPTKGFIPPGERGVFLLGENGWTAYADLFQGAIYQNQFAAGTPSTVAFSPAGSHATLGFSGHPPVHVDLGAGF